MKTLIITDDTYKIILESLITTVDSAQDWFEEAVLFELDKQTKLSRKVLLDQFQKALDEVRNAK